MSATQRAKRSSPALVVFVGALMALASTAKAELVVCNKTSADLIFDVSEQAPDCQDSMERNNYRLSGWYEIQPNQCILGSSANLMQTGISWTAAQGESTVWGDSVLEYAVPLVSHNQMCLRNVYDYCNVDTSRCNMYAPHNYLSSGTRDKTLDIMPNGLYILH